MILPDLITAQARKSPESTAYIFHEEKISFGELESRVNRCTTALQKMGIGKDMAVAIILRNCPEFVIFAMALSKLGAILIPINFLEKAERVSLILNDAKAVGVLTSKEFLKTVTEAQKNVPSLKHVLMRENFIILLEEQPWTGKSSTAEDDLMMLLYTSGTTGLPKGVMLTHKNFLANVKQCLEAISLNSSDKFLCLLPMFHSFSWTTCVLIPLYLGAQTVIIESLLPFDPVMKSIWKHHITLFVAMPQIYAALASKISGAKAMALRLVNPVRLCISGAAPLTATVHKNFEKNLGVPLLEGYGLTEASPVASLNPESKRKVGTVGLPLPGVSIQIRDENGKKLDIGEAGEIHLRGDNIMKGYYNKPSETKDAFTDDGWLRTGDIGKFDNEGYLSIVDRKKDLIIIKGLNVYPQDIENVIAMHEAVKEVAVVGKRDPETGDETVRAFITLKEGRTVDKSEIFSLCREHLAPYKRPKDVIFINEMPKNALQKILKKDLRERP
jgi:long-chain acyl-CoA synthetase